MKKAITFLLLLGICMKAYTQQVITNDSFSDEELVSQLVQGCVEISNVSSTINGSVNGITSYARFDRGTSSFPFENGLVLTSGAASDAGTPATTSPLNEGTDTWGTDADLEAALGITNTLNATAIEFDFVSVTNQISFNYLLASEEYFADYPCRFSDSFAFLIRPAGSTGPYTNIALVPGTTIPVSTSVIHDEIVGFCPAENEEYFAGYDLGDTNYNGRTTVMTAIADIIPNELYHVKLVIADGTDENFDSAIFIQGNSFNASVDLGVDVETCADSFLLDGDIGNDMATYQWFISGTPIAGSDSPTLTATSSGTYRVEITIPIGTSTCTIEDTVEVILNSAQSVDTIEDYELCDEFDDGVEEFDLSTKTDEIIAELPTATYDISYHPTETDALNDTSPLDLLTTNTTSPQEVFIRAEDVTNGCIIYGSFNLIVIPRPDITNPTAIDTCGAFGVASVDLTIRDNEIVGGETSYIVSYHSSLADAENNANAYEDGTGTFTGPTEIVFVRVFDPATGCYITTTLTVNVGEIPQDNPLDENFVDACDPEHDGFATFDLTEILDQLTAGLTGVTVTVHTSVADAETGDNPIPDITAFDNTVSDEQVLFVRIEDDESGCYTVANIEVHTNALLTATNIRDFNRCDDDSGDEVELFDFEDVTNTIVNGIEGIDITYYLTEDDRAAGINAIDETVLFANTSNPQEIFITLVDDEGCEEEDSFFFIINSPVMANDVGTLTFCDTNDDGFIFVDLTVFDDDIRGAETTFNVTYYENLADVGTINSIAGLTNTTNPQEVFYAITNPDTGCADASSFMLEIIPAPTVTTPTPLLLCDDDTDAIGIVDLTSKIPEIIADTTDILISFHPTGADASAAINEIDPATTFETATTTTFARVESTITGCFALVPVDVIVNIIPEVVATDIYQLCEVDVDETESFIFETRDEEILNGQTGMTVLYFETAEDALDRTDIIDKVLPYENTSNPQTIHVRIENDTDPDCFAVSSFVIQVSPAPLYNLPIDWFVCDDASNDAVHIFDLNEKITEITEGIPQDLTVQFFESEADAIAIENEITDLEFENTSNPQVIYTLVTNDSDCDIILSFELNVIQVPETNAASDIIVCDDDYDGTLSFDLTEAEFEILNVRQDDTVISYHETEEDAEDGTNAIASPDNYSNSTNPQQIFVRIFNTISECYVIVPFTITINLPPAINEVANATFCEAEDPGTLDLSLLDEMIVDSTSGVDISYHTSNANAESDVDALPEIYTYVSNPETIFIRVEDSTTGCHIVTDITVTVNPNPVINALDNLEACTDDNDDVTQFFDLSLQDDDVLGGLSPALFEVTYHRTVEDAEDDTDVLSIPYIAFNEQTIYARLEDRTTGCYSISTFQTIIRPLPIIDIPDEITLCLNDLPLLVTAGDDPGNTYEWSTGATTATAEINDIGEYSVIVTSEYGCEETKSFTVIESELATIVEVVPVHFSENNTVTVTATGGGDYLYILDDGAPQISNVFENVSAGYHTVTVLDVNGCGEVTEEVVVIDYPPFFTPNNDTYNDTWHIIGIETLPNSEIYIFDRYGKLLTALSTTGEGWDGLYRGKRMPSNDYWFLAKIVDGDNVFEIRDHFTLKR